jgi:uncharacterized Fe-S center protein
MNFKQARKALLPVFLFLLPFVFSGCASKAVTEAQAPWPQAAPGETTPKETPKVYFTSDISPAGLQAVYDALESKPDTSSITAGRVAVKVSTGEPPNSNYLRPALIKDLVQSLNGVIVESNTAYGGQRINTAMHRQVAKDHGFTDIAGVDILDEEGSLSLPVQGGSRLTENFVGSHFNNYDYYVILSHFKGHPMSGLGGAIKNISIGIASAEGKLWIHTGGKSKTSWDGATDWQGPNQTPFPESMAEAVKAVVDSLDGKILYINAMNRVHFRQSLPAATIQADIAEYSSRLTAYRLSA